MSENLAIHVFQLLAAAEVEENLASVESTIVDWQNIPVSHLTALAKLPKENLAEGLLLASQIGIAQGKKRNATHITQAIKEIKLGKLALTQTSEYIPTLSSYRSGNSSRTKNNCGTHTQSTRKDYSPNAIHCCGGVFGRCHHA